MPNEISSLLIIKSALRRKFEREPTEEEVQKAISDWEFIKTNRLWENVEDLTKDFGSSCE